MQKDPVFDLNNQYRQYLKLVGLKEITMSVGQQRELKRAFMGACGQMLVLLKEHISVLPEDEGIDALEDLNNQVANYWINQASRMN